MTEVTLEGLTKVFDDVTAVADVDLVAPDGEVTALLGPSGCGKTTTLKLVAGLLHPTRGDVRFDGRSVVDVPPEQREAVLVFQRQLLFPYLSVADNVAFGLKMRGVGRRETRRRVADMLERVQLAGYEERGPSQLSGGQQQRVALARALVVEPRVLLLDEPLANLDAHLREDMRALIADIQRELGVTTLIVTHDQEEAVTLADRVGLVLDGRLHQVGAPLDFYERPASVAAARFFGARNFIPARLRGGVAHTELGDLKVGEAPGADGPATLVIRPEAIDLDGERRAANTVAARLEDVRVLGTYARLRLRVGDVVLEAAAPPELATGRLVGEELVIALPPDKLRALAPDEGG